jgi:NAD/NADP transhydrogenase alpha subunit
MSAYATVRGSVVVVIMTGSNGGNCEIFERGEI